MQAKLKSLLIGLSMTTACLAPGANTALADEPWEYEVASAKDPFSEAAGAFKQSADVSDPFQADDPFAPQEDPFGDQDGLFPGTLVQAPANRTPVDQMPVERTLDPAAPRLVDAVPSDADYRDQKANARRLRTARAQYHARQRMERLERNRWAGYEPLRPNWNSIPMMSSRYPAQRTVWVPVYVYPY
ncbi:hypothetical protein FYK55_21635 [Roseiconus nitratireducens]|uniref:Uncharacterized protein n=1 Tax=Roseiconus nitratireducens TaxID=2605748 RepID=A0A5M6D4W1_9BACT|nr:hypothetical protein [Roseiconus nitratireducens]KAA5540235.1 hypothetical protein FYK55_21635 [Roseiconus nitratireducens]